MNSSSTRCCKADVRWPAGWNAGALPHVLADCGGGGVRAGKPSARGGMGQGRDRGGGKMGWGEVGRRGGSGKFHQMQP